MKIELEISMYPLTEDYIPPIKAFIEALEAVEGLQISTGDMSTRISGDSTTVWDTIRSATDKVFDSRRAAFIIKAIKGKD